MFHCVVIDKASGRELARYSYDTARQAREAVRNVKAIRVTEQHQRVAVRFERDSK